MLFRSSTCARFFEVTQRLSAMVESQPGKLSFKYRQYSQWFKVFYYYSFFELSFAFPTPHHIDKVVDIILPNLCCTPVKGDLEVCDDESRSPLLQYQTLHSSALRSVT